MAARKLRADEQSVCDWNGIYLTTNRVLRAYTAGSDSFSTGIQLAMITSTRVTRSHKPWLLALAVLSGLLAAVVWSGRSPTAGLGIALVAAVAAVAYLLTRSVVVQISSGADTIQVGLQGGQADLVAAAEFLDSVDEAAWRSRQR